VSQTALPARPILGLGLLTLTGWIHFRDIPEKLGETSYMGWLYILLVAGCAAAGAWLLSNLWRTGYVLGSVISAGAVIFYVLTRTVGLPGARDDVGNWSEPAGIVALLSEVAFLIVALLALRRAAQLPPGRREN
jgi:hypothetical protein